MDWLVLIFLVPLILVPVVLLCGFAGCGLDVVGTAILPPSNLSATAGGTDLVNLSWQNNGGAGVVFFVDRGPPGGSLLPIASNVSATTFANSGLPEGTTFLYQVRSGTCPDLSRQPIKRSFGHHFSGNPNESGCHRSRCEP